MSRPPHPLSTAMLDAAVDLLTVSGQTGVVNVTGASMLPTFRGVERMWVQFCPERVAFGDVLVFRQKGILVVHRLVQPAAARLRTRGDGTIAFDPWLDPLNVIARVAAIEIEDRRWRRIDGRRARLYAWALGTHDLLWGGLGALTLKFGGRRGPDWQWRLGRIDGFLLRCVHALFFRSVHPICPQPAVTTTPEPVVHARCYTAARTPTPKKSCS